MIPRLFFGKLSVGFDANALVGPCNEDDGGFGEAIMWGKNYVWDRY